jgi:hypothetical protein
MTTIPSAPRRALNPEEAIAHAEKLELAALQASGIERERLERRANAYRFFAQIKVVFKDLEKA